MGRIVKKIKYYIIVIILLSISEIYDLPEEMVIPCGSNGETPIPRGNTQPTCSVEGRGSMKTERAGTADRCWGRNRLVGVIREGNGRDNLPVHLLSCIKYVV
jgi:hypothetical protein